MPKVSSNNFDISSIYTPKIRELEIKPYQDRVTKAEAVSQVNNEKSLALLELQQLTSNLSKAVSPFAYGKNGAFDLKSAGATTNDVGDGSDYVNVSADNTAVNGQIDIRVNRVATISSITVAAGNAHNGFAIGQDMCTLITGLNGGAAYDATNPATFPEIIINSAGVPLSISVLPGDTLLNIRDKINAQLAASNIRADIVNNGTEFLAVSSTVTGVNALEVNFKNSTGVLNNDPLAGAVYTNIEARAPGVNAEVVIKGVVVNSASNTLGNIIPGVTVELKKANLAGDASKKLTINVKADVEPIINNFAKLVDLYNELIEFAEAQTKTTLVNGVPTPASDAYLYNSTALKQALASAKALISFTPGHPASMASLADIGIGVAKPLPGAPKETKLQILDVNKLRNAISSKPDDIKKLFQKNAAITNVGPTTANLAFIPQVSNMPSGALGVAIRISEDGAGNVTFTLPGGLPQPANLAGGNTITFPNTALDGLVLGYTGAVVGQPQNFDITLSQGVGDRFASQAKNLGTKLLNEITLASRESTNLEKKEKIAQDAFDAKQKKMDAMLASLELMAQLFQNEMDNLDMRIDAILGN